MFKNLNIHFLLHHNGSLKSSIKKILGGVLLGIPHITFAGPLADGLESFEQSNSGLRTEGGLIEFVANLISWGLGLVGTVFFVIILLNGFKYMTAGGNTTASQESVKAITNAVIGLVIIMGAFLITNYVASALLSV